MNNRGRCLFVLLLVMKLVIFMHIRVAKAEVKKGFEIELYGGTMKTDMGQTIVVDQYRTIVTESEDGETFGMRLGYNFNQHLGLDWNLGLSTARYEASLFDEEFEACEDVTTGLFITDLNLVVHLLKGPIVPFLTAGGGIIGTVDQNPFAYNSGGGVKIYLTKKIAIRLDFRVYHAELKDDLEEVDIGPGGTLVQWPFSYKEDFNLQEISIGLTFAF